MLFVLYCIGLRRKLPANRKATLLACMLLWQRLVISLCMIYMVLLLYSSENTSLKTLKARIDALSRIGLFHSPAGVKRAGPVRKVFSTFLGEGWFLQLGVGCCWVPYMKILLSFWNIFFSEPPNCGVRARFSQS